MGITLPVLARQLTDLKESLGGSVGLLYGANTLGAAIGAITVGYVLLPSIGVKHTIFLAVLLNFLAAGLGTQLRRILPTTQTLAPPVHTDHAKEMNDVKVGITVLTVLFVGGMVTLALEVVYIHLLAIVVGNSTYAFSLMLFTFLTGLSLGSIAARKWIRLGESSGFGLAVCELMLAVVILAGVFFLDGIPGYFATFAGYGMATTFAEREIVRGVVSFLVMVPPTLCIGAYYTLAMELVGSSFPRKKIGALGLAAAINTTGNIVGALIGAFLLIPFFGSLGALHVLAVTAFLLGLLAFTVLRSSRRIHAIALAMATVGLFLLQPKSLDYQSLSSGANVYFQNQGYGRVIDHAESVDERPHFDRRVP